MNYLRRLLQPLSTARTHVGNLVKPPAAMSQVKFQFERSAPTSTAPKYHRFIIEAGVVNLTCTDKKYVKVNVISYDEMKRAATAEGVHVFDVRSPEEFSRGKILNAVNIPVDRFEDALKMNPEDFKNKFLADKPKPNDNFIVHCQAGVRAARAAGIAMAQGYTNVKSYAGGYKEWSEKGGR